MKTIGRLADLPCAHLVQAEAPIESLANLTKQTGGAALYAKRDDMQGIAFGGNKARQLEYYFGQALDLGADTVLITGAVQSNFCRLAAAFAAKLGMTCHIQQEERVAKDDPLYRRSGNVLIEKLLGAVLHSFPSGEDEAGADTALEEIADRLRDEGKTPYVIHLAPGHAPYGALGYIDCAREILDQAARDGLRIDHVAVPSGSGATHAGLLFGLRALGATMPVTGFCVRRNADQQMPRLQNRMTEIAKLLEMENPVADADIVVDDRFLAPGYGQLNSPTEAAIRDGARTEALMLDPVYSGKCMAGAIHIAAKLPADQNVLFIHTGGSPALFAYANALEPAL